MAASSFVLCVLLVVLVTAQGCSAQLGHKEPALISALQGVSKALQSFSASTIESLLLQRPNTGALSDLQGLLSLPDMVQLMKKEIALDNEKTIELLKKEIRDALQVEQLTQANAELKVKLAEKDKQVEQLTAAYQEVTNKLADKEKEVSTNITNENEGLRKQLEDKDKKVEELMVANQELTSKLSDNEKQVQDLNTRLLESERRVQQLEDTVQELNQTMEFKKKELDQDSESSQPKLRTINDVPELVSTAGYPAESHTVVTQDGYILTIHRIPHGKAGPSADRPVVFVQHGLMCSSAVWVISTPRKALGFVLADAGYDVWLGNYRGNKYANKHTTLKNTDSRYWQFSWHESGMYDLPAMIDYILERTGQKQLYYVGHSMGNTGFYVMASMRPEYNSKIRAQFSLAPVAFMSHVRSPVIRLMSSFQNSLDLLLKMVGVNEFSPNNEFLAAVAGDLCPDGALTQVICSSIIFLLCGFNEQQFNTTLLPIIPGHVPAGTSTKQLLHYSQDIHSGKFRQYDHGAVRNLLVYGSLSPPDYDLTRITAPVFLYWSDNDWLAGVQDVKELERKLPNVASSTRVANDRFNHVDHMWAIDVLPLLYDNLLAMLATR